MTTEYKTRTRTRRTDEEAEQKLRDLENEQLSEDVECCLADIDAALEEAAGHSVYDDLDPEVFERAYAEHEWREKIEPLSFWNEDESWNYTRAGLVNAWTAQYGHMFTFCCGEPRFDQ